jgi:hypothetical protein
MAKWPDVPAVYGWLRLDRRGRWLLDGNPIRNRTAVEFINRNYGRDDDGCWFFQNGPQRVFVELEYTPMVYQTDGRGLLWAHIGRPVHAVRGVWLDEESNLLLLTEHGPGVIDDRDLDELSTKFCDRAGEPLLGDRLAAAIAAAAAGEPVPLYFKVFAPIEVGSIERHRVPQQFGFDPCPRAQGDSPNQRKTTA